MDRSPSYSAFTSVVKHISDSIEINVRDLGKSIALAGYLGSSKLPQTANASQVITEGGKFTLINNAGALHLSKESI